MNNLSADIQKLPRHYFPKEFKLTTWEAIEPYCKELVEREINNSSELEQWMKDLSELEAVVSEDACWRQIRMTCDTTDKTLEEAFTYFCLEIQPKLQPVADTLNRKLMACPYTDDLNKEKYFTYLRNIKKSIELFREENIPLTRKDDNRIKQRLGCVVSA